MACHRAGNIFLARAIAAMNKARQRGEVPPIKGQLCVDCGAPAKHYDHRDYLRPLDVEPVCVRCNLRRGPAWQWQPGSMEHIDLGSLA